MTKILTVFMALLFLSGSGYGQAPSTEELMQVIKRLEARIAELEAKASKSSETPEVEAPKAAPAEIQQEVEALKKTASENAPILDFFKSTQVSGYVDAYYAYNVNRPPDQSIGFRGVNTNHNSFQFNAAKLSFNKATTDTKPLGYRLDLVYGPLADSFNVPFEPPNAGFSVQRNILNAYVSYRAPLGKGLNFDFGKFTTFIGAEVFDTIDNWNYQQGLLFSYAQPYYHTGLRTTYAASDKVGLGFYLVNGWNNSFDNNTGKSLGFSASLTPSSRFSITQAYLGGPEKTGTNEGWRHLADTVVNATVSKNVALKFNYDYGVDKKTFADPSNPDASWQGVAASVRFSTSDGRIALAPRFEYLSDNDGFATGTGFPHALKSLTFTNEYRIRPNMSTKLEYRYDFSNQPIFKKRGRDFLVSDQNVFLVGFVYSFGFGKE